MSYILDALQRAEAERERGHVPGLKSQLVPPAKREAEKARGLRLWQLAAGLALLMFALAFWWWTQAPDAKTAEPLGAPATPQSRSGDVIAAAPRAAPAVPDPATAQTLSPDPLVAPPEPVMPILAPPRPPPPAPKAPAVSAPEAPPASTPAPAANGATVAVPAPPAVAPTVPSFGQLSAEARAQLPAVNVSGSTYSQNPALRMLIANGKVVQEGQDIAPGLKLETIGPRSAVLNHQGMRYSIGY